MRVLLRAHAGDLDAAARMLASLGWPFSVREPRASLVAPQGGRGGLGSGQLIQASFAGELRLAPPDRDGRG
jgi:hypothetical protein